MNWVKCTISWVSGIALRPGIFEGGAHDRVQQHDAVGRQYSVGHLEEAARSAGGRSARRRRSRRCGRRARGTSPSPPATPAGCGGCPSRRTIFCTCSAWFSDNVRPTTLTSYFSMARRTVAPQPQPMSSSVIPGSRLQLAQRQVDLGDLRLFQRHVVTLEVRATVGLGGVQEQPEEVVGQIVVGLHVPKMRRELHGHDEGSLSVFRRAGARRWQATSRSTPGCIPAC